MPDRPILIVAAATPLREDGSALDLDAVGPMVAFLERHGADGVFACGTTGEGINLDVAERKQMARAFREAVSGTLIVHAGAQTTADTIELAADAAQLGADAIGVIPPPYYALDEVALVVHLLAAARACAPLPFYIYAFTARSGYPVSLEVIERVRADASNLAGLKVSEAPFERLEPYLGLGLPVLVGNEPLIPRALQRGAAGSVSALAAAFPDVLRTGLDSPAGAEQALIDLRLTMEAVPFIAAIKHVLGRRGVPVRPDTRAPLRPLSSDEATRLDQSLDQLFAAASTA
jgi:dihydrodipicolinate synthase/N-acetylneuraminate lyase